MIINGGLLASSYWLRATQNAAIPVLDGCNSLILMRLLCHESRENLLHRNMCC
jgi:hypothetical protein